MIMQVSKIIGSEKNKTREVIVAALMDAGSKGLDLEDTSDLVQSKIFAAKLDSISLILSKMEVSP